MMRIQFATDQDRIQGFYLLATHTVVRSLPGRVFEIAEGDLKWLDEHGIHYTIIPVPDRRGTDQTVRTPLTAEL